MEQHPPSTAAVMVLLLLGRLLWIPALISQLASDRGTDFESVDLEKKNDNDRKNKFLKILPSVDSSLLIFFRPKYCSCRKRYLSS